MDTVEETARKLADKVAPIYELLNWRWVTKRGVPAAQDIYETLLELYEDARVMKPGTSVGTGGLRVSVWRDEESIRFYTLSFKIEKNFRP